MLEWVSQKNGRNNKSKSLPGRCEHSVSSTTNLDFSKQILKYEIFVVALIGVRGNWAETCDVE